MATSKGGRPAVVVTAVASTTALATDAESTWSQLQAGKSGIGSIAEFLPGDVELPVRIGGRVTEDFDAELSRVEVRRLSYMQKMALVLSRRLWAAAGDPEVETRRLLVSISHAFGSTRDLWTGYEEFKSRGLRAISPLAVQMHMPNAPAAAVGLDRQAKAGVIAPTVGDASGASAIAEAWRLITLGEADVAICGAVESKIEPLPIVVFNNMGMLATDNDDPEGACRPFDQNRTGMVFGEGGALLLVESEEHAAARGATPLARLMGVGTTSDAYDLLQPDPSGEQEAAAISHAVTLAGLAPTDIDHVNANAAGTKVGDLTEARALRQVFGHHQPAVTAPKAALGHAMGAAGAIEAVLTVQTVRDGVVAPTRNLQTLDPEIDLDVVTGEARPGDYRYAVSNTLGFGGNNVALVFGKY
ncbi:beta-ketoacyl-[acyl-carrier-protein] synthase II [Mycolicibacterium duvalii]|uniref:3-oxoacyl-ACP synthase n=1 Tax=Mycolicibacterium duvalii TaxID=39688 RepID=A0A7I7K680_9MYCO|nr:KasA/KasB family beta-ketoacyl-ACP synthase [Mycolicibacterium duvalii]MCV7366156.1 beta-ketoacyl-ACP synthase [Mycolicibacterium duvalii]PEG38812.1 beta-ketoacyl-[acyl-carrier-protein] synthase II [Mycolicibacterium duvalii]BBX19606.1 3-oxoacyl-ACP synthase [Mycolicibacterium duvalii]